MNVNLDSIKCSHCNRNVTVPANYCDMCGEKLGKAPPSQTIKSYFKNLKIDFKPIKFFLTNKNNQENLIKIGIPTAVIVIGLFMYFSENSNLNKLLLFLFPVMIGTIVGAANIKDVTHALEKSNNWILNKLGSVKDKGGKRHKYYFTPWYWMLYNINNLCDKIETIEVRNGFKITAYLYVCFLMIFVAYIAVSIIVGIILLAIVFWIIAFFTSDETVTSKVIEKKVIKETKPVMRTCGLCVYYDSAFYDPKCTLGYPTKKFDNTPACSNYKEGVLTRAFGPDNYCSGCAAYDYWAIGNECTKGNMIPKSGHACKGFLPKP